MRSRQYSQDVLQHVIERQFIEFDIFFEALERGVAGELLEAGMWTLPVRAPALVKAGDGMLPSDFFHQNVLLSFQEDAIGIRPRDVIGADNMMWRSDHSHSESTFPQPRKIPAGVPDDEQAKPARTTFRGSPAAILPARTILMWRG